MHRFSSTRQGSSDSLNVYTNLTEQDLPPADTKRWVMSRKAIVIAAIGRGLLSRDEACQRYGLSSEELDSWKSLVHQHGVRGLRTTRLQEYRLRLNKQKKK